MAQSKIPFMCPSKNLRGMVLVNASAVMWAEPTCTYRVSPLSESSLRNAWRTFCILRDELLLRWWPSVEMIVEASLSCWMTICYTAPTPSISRMRICALRAHGSAST